jgi:hypothetical protein
MCRKICGENDFLFLEHNYLDHKKGMEKIHYYVEHKRSFLLYLKKKRKRVAEGIVSRNKKKVLIASWEKISLVLNR